MRLSQSMRHHVTRRAIEASPIPLEEKALADRRAKWAEAVRQDALGGPKECKRIEAAAKRITTALEKLPDSIRNGTGVPLRKDIYVNVFGSCAYAEFGDNVRKIAPPRHTLPGDHPLVEEFQAIELQAEALSNRKAKLKAKVRALVGSVTTVEKLLKLWPEAKELLPAETPQTAKLPCNITPEKLNKEIGLPTKKGKK